METPLITTIVPTFRRPHLLKRAIGSALHQTFGNLQVCVYDNASGDETAGIVAEFARQDPRVRYHCHPQNIGSGANFNYALAHVDTPYFSFLSDDDILLPEFYETALASFQEFPDAGYVAASTIVMTEKGEILAIPLSLWPGEGCFFPPQGFLQLINNTLPTWTSILFRKAITDKVGLLDLEIGIPADFDFQLQVAYRSPFVISKKPCAIFVSHEDSFSATPSVAHFWPGWLKLAGNMTNNPDIPEDIKIQARHGLVLYIKKTLFSIGLKLIRNGEFAAARMAADILQREFGQQTRPFMLLAASRIFGIGKLPGRCFACAYDLAQSLRKKLVRGRSQLQEKYGGYAKWL